MGRGSSLRIFYRLSPDNVNCRLSKSHPTIYQKIHLRKQKLFPISTYVTNRLCKI
jgi:hypothetical protein